MLKLRETAVFAMLGAIMFASKIVMEVLPNIHLIGVFVIALTVVYRKKALYPIYVFVMIFGLYYGFSLWWVPYLYIWTVLWGATMLLPTKLPKKFQALIYMSLCAAHGLLYGVLYAPFQALLYSLSFRGTLTWIVAGLPFDLIHCVSNFFCGALILPLISILRFSEKNMGML